ncbi:MAG: dephospho-CoA kinase [Alphaproteobacteria bacterium]|nr:dephospho-CoA kinase [Alphaproteobacteria bacterium]
MKAGPVIIGLTGSIGMGKSTAAKMFVQTGIPLFDSDAAVHNLLAKGGAAVEPVKKIFPDIAATDAIDRVSLGKRVFGDKAALKKLEAIIHPLVSDLRRKFFDQALAQGHDIVVIDVPLLFETGAEHQCDYTVVVSAPKAVQRQRVLGRPGMTEQKFNDILARQLPDKEKRQRADFIIETDYGFQHAEKRVGAIIDKIREKHHA